MASRLRAPAASPGATAFVLSLAAHAALAGLAWSAALATTPQPPGAPIPVLLLRAEAEGAGAPSGEAPPVSAAPPPAARPPEPVRRATAAPRRAPPRKVPLAATAPDPAPAATGDDAARADAGVAGGPTHASGVSSAAPAGGGAEGLPAVASGEAAPLVPRGGYQVRPRYPDSARRAGAEGTTLVAVLVARSGRVERAGVDVSSGHDALDRAAVEAVRRWRFEPLSLPPGAPGVRARIPVSFRLHDTEGGSR